MRERFLLLAVVLAAVPSQAQVMTQTDWSAGPGAIDPVTTWGSDFASADNMSWLSIPGQIALPPTPVYDPHGTVIDDSSLLAFGVETGDFNRDGHQDVVVAFQRSNLLRIWLNDGQDPPGWVEQEVDDDVPEINAVWPVDLDGDGDLDLTATSIEPYNTIFWWRNDDGVGGAWTRFEVERSFTNAFEIHAQDLNGDSRPDILSASYDDSTIVWWENCPPANPENPPTWLRHEVAGDFFGGHAVRAGDLDQDGHMDFAAVSGMVHEAAVWLHDDDAPTGYTKVILASDFEGGRSVRVADLDQDGRLDVVATCWVSDVRWWRNTGPDPSTWPEQIIADGFTGGHHLNVADLDGDGHLDVFGVAFADWDIDWWRNDGGQPITWTEHHVVLNFRGVVQACAADLNNDGIPEIVGSSWILGSFNWWNIAEYTAGSGHLESTILDGEGATDGQHLVWDAQVPEGSSLQVRVRSADTPLDLGGWSAPLSSGDVLPAAQGRYLQYRVDMEIPDGVASPVLREIGLQSSVAVVPDDETPGRMGLLDAWPNPFNPRVTLAFDMAKDGQVRLGMYDLQGRRVATLVDGPRPAGRNQIVWDGCDQRGQGLPSGAYFARLESPSGHEVTKVSLVR